MIKECFSLCVQLLSIIPAFSQVNNRQDSLERAQYKKHLDSLETAFYQAPPYVIVSYYKNDQKLDWSDEMIFYIEKDHQKLVLKPVEGNKFLLPELPSDSIALGFEYKGEKIAFKKSPAWSFAHGAKVFFGSIDQFKELRNKDLENKNGDYYSTPLADLGVPYYSFIRNKKLVKLSQSKKFKGIIYQVIEPRVYGDGTVLTTYEPLL